MTLSNFEYKPVDETNRPPAFFSRHDTIPTHNTNIATYAAVAPANPRVYSLGEYADDSTKMNAKVVALAD